MTRPDSDAVIAEIELFSDHQGKVIRQLRDDLNEAVRIAEVALAGWAAGTSNYEVPVLEDARDALARLTL